MATPSTVPAPITNDASGSGRTVEIAVASAQEHEHHHALDAIPGKRASSSEAGDHDQAASGSGAGGGKLHVSRDLNAYRELPGLVCDGCRKLNAPCAWPNNTTQPGGAGRVRFTCSECRRRKTGCLINSVKVSADDVRRAWKDNFQEVELEPWRPQTLDQQRRAAQRRARIPVGALTPSGVRKRGHTFSAPTTTVAAATAISSGSGLVTDSRIKRDTPPWAGAGAASAMVTPASSVAAWPSARPARSVPLSGARPLSMDFALKPATWATEPPESENDSNSDSDGAPNHVHLVNCSETHPNHSSHAPPPRPHGPRRVDDLSDEPYAIGAAFEEEKRGRLARERWERGLQEQEMKKRLEPERLQQQEQQQRQQQQQQLRPGGSYTHETAALHFDSSPNQGALPQGLDFSDSRRSSDERKPACDDSKRVRSPLAGNFRRHSSAVMPPSLFSHAPASEQGVVIDSRYNFGGNTALHREDTARGAYERSTIQPIDLVAAGWSSTAGSVPVPGPELWRQLTQLPTRSRATLHAIDTPQGSTDPRDGTVTRISPAYPPNAAATLASDTDAIATSYMAKNSVPALASDRLASAEDVEMAPPVSLALGRRSIAQGYALLESRNRPGAAN